MKFPELTYAAHNDPIVKRWIIRTLEVWSGRDYFVPLYERWRTDFVGRSAQVIRPALDLLDVNLEVASGAMPTGLSSDTPLVIVSNHPYGILDGLGALALAESLGRAFKVLIHKDLVRVPEIQPFALPIDFGETREAQVANIHTRNEALALLKEGTTIVVFPAGGVATSPTVFGRAVDLPWKTFTARMILESRAQILPLFFEGQCSPTFQFVSKLSLTLRLSVILREFRRRVGKPLRVHIGDVIPFEAIGTGSDRRAVMNMLYDRVHGMSGYDVAETKLRMARLPAYLRK